MKETRERGERDGGFLDRWESRGGGMEPKRREGGEREREREREREGGGGGGGSVSLKDRERGASPLRSRLNERVLMLRDEEEEGGKKGGKKKKKGKRGGKRAEESESENESSGGEEEEEGYEEGWKMEKKKGGGGGGGGEKELLLRGQKRLGEPKEGWKKTNKNTAISSFRKGASPPSFSSSFSTTSTPILPTLEMVSTTEDELDPSLCPSPSSPSSLPASSSFSGYQAPKR